MVRSTIVIKKEHNTRSKVFKLKKNGNLIIRFKNLKPKIIVEPSIIDPLIEAQRIVITPTSSLKEIQDELFPPTVIQDYSAEGIIKMYYPGIIFDLLTDKEVRETLQNILNTIEMKKMDDVISPGLRSSDSNDNDLTDLMI